MAYGDFKALPKRIAADKVLRDKAFKIAQGKGLANNNENVQLANELHKPIIKKFNKRKVYSSFKDNIWV